MRQTFSNRIHRRFIPTKEVATRFVAILVLLTYWNVSLAKAEEFAGREDREWSDRSGAHVVEARLVAINGSEVTIQRSDSGKHISIDLSQLSDADQDYVQKIRERMSLAEAANSLKDFLDRVRPVLERHSQIPERSADETSVQFEQRTKQFIDDGIEAANKVTRGKSFAIVAQIRDVQAYKERPKTEIERFFGTQEQFEGRFGVRKPEKKNAELDTFDIQIKERDYGAEIPFAFRLKIGTLGDALKVDDFILLNCRLGKSSPRIGFFQIGYLVFEMDVSIVSVRRLDKDFAKPVIDAISKPKEEPTSDQPMGPLLNPRTLTRRQFLDAFYRIDGSDQRGMSVVSEKELFRVFGEPHRNSKTSGRRFWDYYCNDGKILFRMVDGAEGVAVPQGHILIIEIDELE